MPNGYWLATYKKIENKDNLGNYAAKATRTIKSLNIKIERAGVNPALFFIFCASFLYL